ncbi:diguanylate cyclase [Leptospira sp. WS92.C1]
MKKSVKILIVEDEKVVAKDIRNRLLKIGYNSPVIASTGTDAIQKALELKPDLILMDIMLSRGTIDGIEVATELKSKMDVAVIYLTAYADDHSLSRTKATEPYGYIIKPVRTRELQVAIEIALNKHSMEKKLRENRHLLLTTLESIGDCVITTDSKGIVTFMNRMSELLTGWTMREAVGNNIQDIIRIVSDSTRDLITDPISMILRQNEPLYFVNDVQLLDREQKEVPIECTASLIHSDDGKMLGAVLVFRDITERKITEECIRYLAYHDPLTGLPNRALLFERFKQNIDLARPKRINHNMAFLFLDLDDFKQVNDRMGHEAGDFLLKEFSERMKASVREDDIVVRLAGDEFIIILNDLANPDDVELVVKKLLDVVRKPFLIRGQEIIISVSIGISIYPTNGNDLDELIRFADTAMYRSKLHGKNSYAFFCAETDKNVV